MYRIVSYVQHVDRISFAVDRANARLGIINAMMSATAATAAMNPTAVSLFHDDCVAFYTHRCPLYRAAVGMGIPMGIPMGMGMVWVWGL